MKPKILCVCTMGLNRSRYVAKYLKEKGYETRYGGVGPCKFDPEPANPANKEDFEWSDIIIVAREKHKKIVEETHFVKDKRIIVLEVSDSREKAAETHPEFKNMDQSEFNKVWTYPKLREAIESYLPFEEFEK